MSLLRFFGLLISCKLRNLELRKFQLTGEVFKIIVVIIRHRLRLTETWARWLSTVTKQLTWPRGYFNFVGRRSPKIPRNFFSQALISVAAAGAYHTLFRSDDFLSLKLSNHFATNACAGTNMNIRCADQSP